MQEPYSNLNTKKVMIW